MVKIVVLASFNMDLVMRTSRQPAPGETLQGEFATYLGGKGFNQAIAARRLGAGVSVIGRVGDDEFGQRFLDALDREGIDRRCVSVDPEAGTGVATIVVDGDGENAIVQAPQANTRLTYDEIVAVAPTFEVHGVKIPQPLAEADAFLTSLECPVELGEFLASILHDLRTGVPLILNPAPASRIENLPVHPWSVLVPNAIEVSTITGHARVDVASGLEAAQRLARMETADSIVVTLGQDGAVVADHGRLLPVPAFDVKVVDTVGAGDAFCAALAVAMAEGADLAEAVRFANAAGALATTKHGAEPSMPHRHEVEALLAKGATV
ncbi:MAG: ribokinase [Dehalococcoidia bacterium]